MSVANSPAFSITSPPAGAQTGGRRPDGRFAEGNPGGPGRLRAARAAWQTALAECVTDDHLRAIITLLLEIAKAGEPWAIREVLDRTIGKAKPAQDPEQQDEGNGPRRLTIRHAYNCPPGMPPEPTRETGTAPPSVDDTQGRAPTDSTKPPPAPPTRTQDAPRRTLLRHGNRQQPMIVGHRFPPSITVRSPSGRQVP